MRVAFLIGLCLMAVSVKAAWSVNPTPTLTDTGIDIEVSNQQYLNGLYRTSDGTPHVVFGFYSDRTQIWDVNLSNSVSRVLTVSAAGLPPHSPAFTSNNILVVGTADPGHLWTYKPLTGATNYIKACSDRDYYSSATGSDGHVYLGTYGPEGNAEDYDPVAETVKEWGQFDTGVGGSVWIYNIGADNNYIYGTVRENFSPFNWYLGVIEKANTNRTVVFKEGLGANRYGEVFRGTNGFWYYWQNTNDGSSTLTKYWLITNSVPVLQGSTPVAQAAWLRSGVDTDFENWNVNQGWDVIAGFDVTSVSGSVSSATIGFKPTNEVTYTSVTETNGWNTTTAVVDIVFPALDGSLLWAINAYGPMGTFVPGGLTSISGPYKGMSLYNILQVSSSEIYLTGYHKVSMRWNPQLAWNRVPLMSDYAATNVNPYNVLTGAGKYHYFPARGSNGRIHIASQHITDGSGGELGWYDPSTGATGTERTTFLLYSPRDLKPAVGATKLVFPSATGGTIFIWDVATFAQLTNFTVMAAATLDKVVEYESGKLIGVSGTNLVGFTTAGVELWSNNIPSTAWGGTSPIATVRHRLTLGPDNYVWLCAGGLLRRINPVNGSSVSVMTTTTNYNTVFQGGDCYLYGTQLVLKIPNLLLSDSTRTINTTIANVGTINLAP